MAKKAKKQNKKGSAIPSEERFFGGVFLFAVCSAVEAFLISYLPAFSQQDLPLSAGAPCSIP